MISPDRTYRLTIDITTRYDHVDQRLRAACKGGFLALRDPSLHTVLERAFSEGKATVEGVLKVEDQNGR